MPWTCAKEFQNLETIFENSIPTSIKSSHSFQKYAFRFLLRQNLVQTGFVAGQELVRAGFEAARNLQLLDTPRARLG